MAVNRAARAFIPVKKAGESRRTFNHIKFGADGKFLVLHHYGASWYYKANLIFLGMFYGASLYNYVVNSQVLFGKEWFGKAYLGMVTFSIFGLWSFSHRQIKAIHLLKGSKEVSIETFTNFGLTYTIIFLVTLLYARQAGICEAKARSGKIIPRFVQPSGLKTGISNNLKVV